MSLASDELSARIRTLLGPVPGLTEQKMFGGRAFMLDGNMLVCPMKDGGLHGPARTATSMPSPCPAPGR